MSVNDIRKAITNDLFEVHHGSTEYTATFILGNEDHTIGNPLRHIIMRQNETDFCGYSVPHPYEPKMNLRVQSHGLPAIRVLQNSLENMDTMCDLLGNEFENSLKQYQNNKTS